MPIWRWHLNWMGWIFRFLHLRGIRVTIQNISRPLNFKMILLFIMHLFATNTNLRCSTSSLKQPLRFGCLFVLLFFEHMNGWVELLLFWRSICIAWLTVKLRLLDSSSSSYSLFFLTIYSLCSGYWHTSSSNYILSFSS